MTNITLVDSHCHLDFPDFNGEIDELIARADAAGIKYMQTICTHISKFPQVLALAEKYDNIYASVGIHPHEVANETVTTDELVGFSAYKKVIGIGETGLDYYYEHAPRKRQKESFLTHIEAGRITGLPVIIHTRDADDDMMQILESEVKKSAFKFLIHCFSSSLQLAEKAIELGGYISISGIVTFKKATELQEAVKALPMERLLLETDAPFLAPVPFRGKRNEPAYTRNTAEFLAELKQISLSDVAKITTQNFCKVFSLKL